MIIISVIFYKTEQFYNIIKNFKFIMDADKSLQKINSLKH